MNEFSDHPDHLLHFWLPEHRLALCWRTKVEKLVFESLRCPLCVNPKLTHITINKSLVTCQDCLELIHA